MQYSSDWNGVPYEAISLPAEVPGAVRIDQEVASTDACQLIVHQILIRSSSILVHFVILFKGACTPTEYRSDPRRIVSDPSGQGLRVALEGSCEAESSAGFGDSVLDLAAVEFSGSGLLWDVHFALPVSPGSVASGVDLAIEWPALAVGRTVWHLSESVITEGNRRARKLQELAESMGDERFQQVDIADLSRLIAGLSDLNPVINEGRLTDKSTPYLEVSAGDASVQVEQVVGDGLARLLQILESRTCYLIQIRGKVNAWVVAESDEVVAVCRSILQRPEV